MRIVIKRKKVDTQTMFAVFNTKPSFPLCRKCQTPFNYTWRNSRTDIVTLRHISDLGGRKDCTSTDLNSGAAPEMVTEEAGKIPPYKASKCLINSVGHFVASTSNPITGRIDPAGAPELWYVRNFRRQLDTYIKPQLKRPSLSTQGGRYPSGARVECFEGKGVWYPGTVTVSHENETYDVLFDDGDIAQLVFPHMVRFQPIHTDSSLVCCSYGLALAAGVIWPLMGFVYLSGVDSKRRGALVALPALLLGAIGVFAVVIQFFGIFKENRSAGPCTPAWYAAIMAVPWASLVLVGGLSVAKASSMSPSSPGSWLEVSRETSIVESGKLVDIRTDVVRSGPCTGGGYHIDDFPTSKRFQSWGNMILFRQTRAMRRRTCEPSLGRRLSRQICMSIFSV